MASLPATQPTVKKGKKRPINYDIPKVASPTTADMTKLANYIQHKWDELTRYHDSLFMGMLNDDKVPVRDGARPVLYISRHEDEKTIKAYLRELRKTVLERVEKGEFNTVTAKDIPQLDLRILPENFRAIKQDRHGLLYLPRPYVVPGGRFNETYGWDSAFIVRGLILDGKYDTAKDVVDNKIYSIIHYDMILNANRSYYLGRSQAPFLTNKVLDIYHHYDQLSDPQPKNKIEWLKSTLEGVNKYYKFWTSPPHIHRASGLSYYNDMNEAPGIEVEFGEKDHYPHALKVLRNMYREKLERDATLPPNHPRTYQERKDEYYLALYYIPERAGLTKTQIDTLPLEEKDALTGKFYRGDRAMRASGFDPSRRFGFFNVDIINHLPVCLNCLLYIMERETAEIYYILSEDDSDARDTDGQLYATLARRWKERAARRKKRINQWLWDEADEQIDVAAKYPSYRDYNFHYDLCHQYDIPLHRNYVFATAFYPLWAGIANKEQAAHVVKHIYPKLITPHGLMTSARETGSQWDAPFAWAPLQTIAVRGLIRYGYIDEALAIAYGFLNTVQRGFSDTGKIFEKYDMQEGSHNVSAKINKGYSVNVEGFGWTNAVVIELLRIIEQHGKLR
ncbi:MAG: alpha,alpha-trehalase [Alphaproteobacteria bacterium]|nr:alpha,alpha-trehalase [Alphaproteobacteria bacterium]